MSDFLTRMAAASRARSKSAQTAISEPQLLQQALRMPEALPLTLSDAGFDLIAEVKRRSPSMGQLADEALAPADQAEHYARAGAAAISVLTEPEQFNGELADLRHVVERVTTRPAMRKDFLATTYQVIEARAAGAGGVLLVAAMLERDELTDMLSAAHELGMFALVEAFDEKDLENCLPVVEKIPSRASDGSILTLLGVNCRDLRSLEVNFARFGTMAQRLPAGIPWIAESGVTLPAHAAEVAGLGYSLALVGTALMQSDDPAAIAEGLIAAGRRARASA